MSWYTYYVYSTRQMQGITFFVCDVHALRMRNAHVHADPHVCSVRAKCVCMKIQMCAPRLWNVCARGPKRMHSACEMCVFLKLSMCSAAVCSKSQRFGVCWLHRPQFTFRSLRLPSHWEGHSTIMTTQHNTHAYYVSIYTAQVLRLSRGPKYMCALKRVQNTCARRPNTCTPCVNSCAQSPKCVLSACEMHVHVDPNHM